jgi:hypothetical protein
MSKKPKNKRPKKNHKKQQKPAKKTQPQENEVKLEVPVALKVLCILSFMGFIYCLVRDTGDYFAYSNFEELAQSQDQEAFEKLETKLVEFEKNDIDITLAGMEKLTLSAIYRTIFDVLAMVGTALMFFRIKRGFYIYAVFQLLYVIVPFVMFGIGAMVVYDKSALVPPLIYLILFTTQFKHLNR